MKYLLFLLPLFCFGCSVKADVIKACGEACKDQGGVKYVTGEQCECRGR